MRTIVSLLDNQKSRLVVIEIDSKKCGEEKQNLEVKSTVLRRVISHRSLRDYLSHKLDLFAYWHLFFLLFTHHPLTI